MHATAAAFLFLGGIVAASTLSLAASDTIHFQLPSTLNLDSATFADPGQPWPRFYDAPLITFWRMGPGPLLPATWPVGHLTSLDADRTGALMQVGLAPAADPVQGQNTGATVQFLNATDGQRSGTFGAYLNTFTNPPEAGQDLRYDAQS